MCGSGPDTNSSLLRAGIPWRARQLYLSQLPGIGENHSCFGSQESAAGVRAEVRVYSWLEGTKCLISSHRSPRVPCVRSTPGSTLCMLHPRELIPEVNSNGF